MENIKLLTKEELQNLTKEQLEEMLIDTNNQYSQKEIELKELTTKVNTVINDWLKQFNIDFTTSGFYFDTNLTTYEQHTYPNSTYYFYTNVNTNVHTYFELRICDNDLYATTHISYIRKQNYNKTAVILLGKVLEKEEELCNLVKSNVDTNLINDFNILANNQFGIAMQIKAIERAKAKRQYEIDKAKAYEQLKNAKYYKYQNGNTIKYYAICKAMNRTVTMQEICIHRYSPQGYYYGKMHHFNLKKRHILSNVN